MNDARFSAMPALLKRTTAGKDGEEKDSTLFHGIVTPAPIQKIWGIGRLFTHPAGKRQEITMTGKTNCLIGAPGLEATTSDLALSRMSSSLPSFPPKICQEWIKAPSSILRRRSTTRSTPHLAHAEIGFLWTVVKKQPQGPPHHRPLRGGKTSGRHGNGPAPSRDAGKAVVWLRSDSSSRSMPNTAGHVRARLHYSRT